MLRLGNLKRWTRVKEGESYPIAGDNLARPVSVEVNAPGECILMYRLEGMDNFEMLTLVRGLDRVEFSCQGNIEIAPLDGECSFYTAEGQDVAIRVIDPQSYTVLHERREINPELEAVRYAMEQNARKREALQKAEWERRNAALEGKINELTRVSATSGNTSGGQQTGDGGASDPQAGTTPDGTPVSPVGGK